MSFDERIVVYFGDEVIRAGFLPVPHLLNRHYGDLGISEEQLVFIHQLMAQVWDLGSQPRNLRDIANRMHKSLPAVRRYGQQLNAAGLLIIRQRYKDGAQVGNDYDLTPLWEALRPFAPARKEDEGVTVGEPIRRPPIKIDSGPPIKNDKGGRAKMTRLAPSDSRVLNKKKNQREEDDKYHSPLVITGPDDDSRPWTEELGGMEGS